MEDILEQECIYIDKNNNEHIIYPMLLKNYLKVERLFLKINSEFLYFNLPTPKLNRKGNIVIDKATKEPAMDDSSYSAMMQLFELALHESREEIEQWIDLKNGVQILDEYRQLSSLKKKIQENIQNQILQTLSQA